MRHPLGAEPPQQSAPHMASVALHPNRSSTKRAGVLVALIGVAIPCLLAPSPAHAARLPAGLSPRQAAHALEEAIRRGQPVQYNGNVIVEAVAENHRHEIFTKSTDAPLVYSPDPAVPGDVEYFRLPLSRKKPLRVRPIPAEDIIAVKRVVVVKGHPPVTVVSDIGVVTIELGLFPSVEARLSDGSHTTLFVGVTTFIMEHVER